LRLWDARIGRWLTTDPYGEFYSPYLGMGNNPIRLTDPDGGKTDDVIVGGDQANEFVKQLNEHSSLRIERNSGTGKLNTKILNKRQIDRLSESDKQIYSAIVDPSVEININAISRNSIPFVVFDGAGLIEFVGGAFMGNFIRDSDNKVFADQTVNPLNFKEFESFIGTENINGTFAVHELTEAYLGAKISQKTGIPASFGFEGGNNLIFNRAHKRALTEPSNFRAIQVKNKLSLNIVHKGRVLKFADSKTFKP